MTDNEKLARWQGWEPHDRGGWCSPSQFWFKSYPDYLNDDATAMSLLDTLRQKKYWYTLQNNADGTSSFVIGNGVWQDWDNALAQDTGYNVAGCIRDAVLELIGKEDV